MLRNKDWALDLLNILVDEPTGAGMNRQEIRMEFGSIESNSKLGSEELWDAVDYHLHLLETAGFVRFLKDADDRAHDYFEMTWAGHDYHESNAPHYFPGDFVVG